jgi:hypothetical protein
MQIAFVAEYGKTSIFLRICADAPNFQMRSEDVGQWSTEVFLRTAVSGGCSPSSTSWWRMVYNIDPNTGETFRIYATANDTVLSEATFMQRAARTDCRVTGYATGYCTSDQPYRPLPVSVPDTWVDAPTQNAQVGGIVLVSGWALDLGSLSGPGITDVQIYLNGVMQGSAAYGAVRTDVANVFGDARFGPSGYSFNLDTRGKSGPATIQVRYRSAISGQWSAVDRAVILNNQTSNAPPNTPLLTSPAGGATLNNRTVSLAWQDTGDPDNGPRSYRDFYAQIRKADGSWSADSSWQIATNWTITLPSDGAYLWRVQSGDGSGASPWSAERSFTVQTTVSTLNVRYVDQVYVQQVPENGYWNHCGPASAAMVLYYERKESRDVLFDRQATLDLVCRVKPGCRGGADVGMTLNTFRQKGLSATMKSSPSIDDIRASINAGHPVLMGISQAYHVVVATGYQDGGKILINDPFGGKNWWSNTEQRNDRKDGRWISRPSSPARKGEQVAYVYGSELGARYGIFITGPAPTPTVVRANVSQSSGGVVHAPGATIVFPGAAASSKTLAQDDLTVTFTPVLTTSHPIDGYIASLSSFQLSALDTNSQPVLHYDRPFTFTVQLDQAIVDLWGVGGEQTIGQVEEGASSGTVLTDAKLSKDNVLIVGWSSTEQRWLPLPTTADLGRYQVNAQSSDFTEFAVVVKPTYTINVPIVQR